LVSPDLHYPETHRDKAVAELLARKEPRLVLDKPHHPGGHDHAAYKQQYAP